MRWLLVLLLACSTRPDDSLPLTPYLRKVAALDDGARRDAIDGWLLDRRQWQATVVPPFDTRYDDYERDFETFASFIDKEFAFAPTAMSTHRHYADDPGHGEQITRWALPVLAETYAMKTQTGPTGVAFLRVDGRWKVVVAEGFVHRTIKALDAACWRLLVDGDTSKPCRDIGWEVADAALRNQRDRFEHACTLARTACGKPSP